MAYLAGNRLHEYRIDCLQQRRLECVSVFAVPATDGRDPTISLNGHRGEGRRSFEVVRDQACRRGGGSESQGNNINSFHLDDWILLDIESVKLVNRGRLGGGGGGGRC